MISKEVVLELIRVAIPSSEIDGVELVLEGACEEFILVLRCGVFFVIFSCALIFGIVGCNLHLSIIN